MQIEGNSHSNIVINKTDINPLVELRRLAGASDDKQSTQITISLYNGVGLASCTKYNREISMDN